MKSWRGTGIRVLIGGGLLLAVAQLALAQARPSAALERVHQSGVLSVCTTGDYKPFSYRRPDGGYEGLDIDAVQKLAQDLQVRVEFVQTSWRTLLADFIAGKCDLAAGGISVTPERAKDAAFSLPYLADGKSAIARCADRDRFASLDAIDQPDTRAIVNPGGTNERFAALHLKRATVRIFPDNVTIFDEIVAGRADVMITDTSETMFQHKLHPELCPVHPEAPFQSGQKAYLLPREDPAFKTVVDQWLSEVQANGEMQRIEDRWLR